MLEKMRPAIGISASTGIENRVKGDGPEGLAGFTHETGIQ